MTKRAVLARDWLASQGIHTPRDLSQWARKRGLLSVHIIYVPAQSFFPACWQVVWPGHRTDRNGPAWQQGHKTFLVRSVADKARFEASARAWASREFEVADWFRIEGLGGSLFPGSVVEELQHYLPDLAVTRQRQHSKKKT